MNTRTRMLLGSTAWLVGGCIIWAACGTVAIANAALDNTRQSNDPEHTKDSLETVKKNLDDKKAILLDVREQKEWDAGHLKLASLVPLSQLHKEPEKAVEGLDKDKIVYAHCKSGGRTLLAAKILQRLGYEVRPLKPGFEDLVKAGFEQAKQDPR